MKTNGIDNKTLSCVFVDPTGFTTVQLAKRVTPNKLLCVSPPVSQTGNGTLAIILSPNNEEGATTTPGSSGSGRIITNPWDVRWYGVTDHNG